MNITTIINVFMYGERNMHYNLNNFSYETRQYMFQQVEESEQWTKAFACDLP